MIQSKNLLVFIAEDDADDRMLIEEALQENSAHLNIRFANDGQELIDMLGNTGASDSPHFIILDLNMPKVDGREVLKFIKKHKIYKRIPTIVLTTSHADMDIDMSYDLGANSFITKPTEYAELVNIGKLLTHYWFQTVKLPEPC